MLHKKAVFPFLESRFRVPRIVHCGIRAVRATFGTAQPNDVKMSARRSRRRPMGPYANCTPSEAEVKALERIEASVQNPPDGLIFPGALL